jgi:hypothetical protein
VRGRAGWGKFGLDLRAAFFAATAHASYRLTCRADAGRLASLVHEALLAQVAVPGAHEPLQVIDQLGVDDQTVALDGHGLLVG